MTEEPLWRVMRNGKYAEQKEKEKTASRFVPENLIGSLRTPVRFPILATCA